MDSERRKDQLQGPKPAALMVSRSSTKIKKHHNHRSPVIVHLRSPKVIHVRPEEFMSIVQQLTGNHRHSPSDAAGTNMKTTPARRMEKRSAMDDRQIEGFIGSVVEPRGLSVDFQALMHFVDFA